MSDRTDRLRRGGIPQGAASRAAGAQAPLVTGMLSPATPFVADDNTLAPVSFRFLNELLRRVSELEARLAAAGVP